MVDSIIFYILQTILNSSYLILLKSIFAKSFILFVSILLLSFLLIRYSFGLLISSSNSLIEIHRNPYLFFQVFHLSIILLTYTKFIINFVHIFGKSGLYRFRQFNPTFFSIFESKRMYSNNKCFSIFDLNNWSSSNSRTCIHCMQ